MDGKLGFGRLWRKIEVLHMSKGKISSSLAARQPGATGWTGSKENSARMMLKFSGGQCYTWFGIVSISSKDHCIQTLDESGSFALRDHVKGVTLDEDRSGDPTAMKGCLNASCVHASRLDD